MILHRPSLPKVQKGLIGAKTFFPLRDVLEAEKTLTCNSISMSIADISRNNSDSLSSKRSNNSALDETNSNLQVVGQNRKYHSKTFINMLSHEEPINEDLGGVYKQPRGR